MPALLRDAGMAPGEWPNFGTWSIFEAQHLGCFKHPRCCLVNIPQQAPRHVFGTTPT